MIVEECANTEQQRATDGKRKNAESILHTYTGALNWAYHVPLRGECENVHRARIIYGQIFNARAQLRQNGRAIFSWI